jgi:hypothetical protein
MQWAYAYVKSGKILAEVLGYVVPSRGTIRTIMNKLKQTCMLLGGGDTESGCWVVTKYKLGEVTNDTARL